MSVALITGITGQDGYYLARNLLAEGLDVWGLSRSDEIPLDLPRVHAAPATDLRDTEGLRRLLARVRPDEIYHLTAETSVVDSWCNPGRSIDVNAGGAGRLLAAARDETPRARIFLASSSEIFGDPAMAPQTELTPIRPVSPYGAAKSCAHHLGWMYRRHYDMHVAIGILYNHESPRRPESFVSRKITSAVASIARGSRRSIALGNLHGQRDWGDAEDTVRAMPLMLRHTTPRDWIVATGVTHTVREWCEIAFDHVELDWRDHVTIDRAAWRPVEQTPLVGDASAIRDDLGWAPTRTFRDLVIHLVEADLAAHTTRPVP